MWARTMAQSRDLWAGPAAVAAEPRAAHGVRSPPTGVVVVRAPIMACITNGLAGADLAGRGRSLAERRRPAHTAADNARYMGSDQDIEMSCSRQAAIKTASGM